jgi:spermidine synthase
MNRRSLRAALLLCFFLTGMSGLMCEVVWVRSLTLTFGATKPAISTVLATFMAGLALGSAYFGRLADRKDKLIQIFATLEVSLGVYIMVTPVLLRGVRELFVASISAEQMQSPLAWMLRLLLASVVLLIPTTLMGGTLPLLAKLLVEPGEAADRLTGRLYAINTFGAVIGCGLGVIAPIVFGLSGTLFVAGIVDFSVGLLALLAARTPIPNIESPNTEAKTVETPNEESARGKKSKKNKSKNKASANDENDPALAIMARRFALAVAAFTGFAGLALEVSWFRILVLVIGSSTYAFALMLGVFLIGLALGASLFIRFAGRFRDNALPVAGLLVLLGGTTLGSVAVYRWLPYWFRILADWSGDKFLLFLAMQSLLCAAVMLLQTMTLGAAFPAVVRMIQAKHDDLGQRVGSLYFSNTLGAIVGSLSASFIFIPLLGVQRSVVAIGIVAIIMGCMGLSFTKLNETIRERGPIVLAIAAAVTAHFLPAWDRQIMTAGPYVNPIAASQLRAQLEGNPSDELLFYDETGDAVISVHQNSVGELSYRANGKSEARVMGASSTRAWTMLGHLPLLLADKPSSALLVGLGAGITLGAMERHPVETIDVIEIEPAVISAARFFNNAHHSALDDSRVRLIRADGRAYLAGARRSYPVIVSGVSDPWIRGVSNLFSVEYFRQLREHLEPGGIACIWLQNYRVGTADMKTMLGTLAAAFPHVSLWYDGRGPADLMALASDRPFELDHNRLQERLRTVAADLQPHQVSKVFDVVAMFLADDADLRRFSAGAPLNTDDRPILETNLPFRLRDPIDKSIGDRVLELLHSVEQIGPRIKDLKQNEYDEALGMALSEVFPRRFQARKLLEASLVVNPNNQTVQERLKLIATP